MAKSVSELDSTQREPAITRVNRTGSWEKAVVYDRESGKVDIRKIQDIEKAQSTDGEKLRTDATRSKDDKFLARLSLDRMGFFNRALLALGYITTLYVSASSRTLTAHGESSLETLGYESTHDQPAG
ncbi:hypothetical protein BU23DRAFT_565311 [Bimuria novae-zelandiae CBS 107.79]|uniref:Uncharacterized protein n=1 Tax=Bimuria novae-zelandiae CBS 107.79 TaxID=1447943 RepID=A0A6A5VJJ3_9PLEO|nr:hypothetical protein BU23DRAFT_565311 [Bimuria novae-zelandiae CBS 107.79]